MDCVYLICHRASGLVKIGITSDWPARAHALKVAHKCDALLVVALCDNLAGSGQEVR